MDGATLLKLRADLGLTDASRDAWIRQRGDSLLAQMRALTGAPLAPLRRFNDIFHGSRCWVDRCCEGLTPKWGPIVEIESLSINGVDQDPTSVRVTTDNRISFFNNPAAYNSEVSLVYTAGYPELPPDLYDVVLSILQQLFQQSIAAGGSPFQVPTKVSLVDVGSLEYKTASSFAEMFGPFGSILDAYTQAMMVGAPLVVESFDLGVVPLPVVSGINPTSALLAAAPFVMTVSGLAFKASDLILFDGAAQATTFVDAQTLTTSVDPSRFTVAGSMQVQVQSGPLRSDPTLSPVFTWN